MPDLLTHLASPLMAYLALWALLTVDAFLPVVPVQAVMITAGALTAYGVLDLRATIAAAALGVLTGDLACYLIGGISARHPGGAAARRLGRGTQRVRPNRGPAARVTRKAAAKLTGGLRRPGPVVLMLCRFVPGGRMAACYTAGRRRYPARRFVAYAVTAAVCYATYGSVVGHLFGTAITESPWRLLLVAVVAAAGFGAAGLALAMFGGDPERPAGAADPADPGAAADPAAAAGADAEGARGGGAVTPGRATSTGGPPP